jgi:hypothetical protein
LAVERILGSAEDSAAASKHGSGLSSRDVTIRSSASPSGDRAEAGCVACSVVRLPGDPSSGGTDCGDDDGAYRAGSRRATPGLAKVAASPFFDAPHPIQLACLGPRLKDETVVEGVNSGEYSRRGYIMIISTLDQSKIIILLSIASWP